MRTLFITRLMLYFTAVILPATHPAMAVSYDVLSRMVWLFLVPIQMMIAYGLSPRRVSPVINAGVGLAVSVGLVLLSGETSFSAFSYGILAGLVSWSLTRMIFFGRGRYFSIAGLELFFPSIIYYRLLMFTRASEDIAAQSSRMTLVIFVISIGAFLLHGAVLYLAAYPDRARKKTRRELAVLLTFGLPLFIALALLIPGDFVKNATVFNEWNEEAPTAPQDLGEDGEPGRGQQGEGLPGGNQSGGHNRNGLPLGSGEEKFPSGRNGSEGQGGQSGQGSTAQNGGGSSGSSSGEMNRLQGVPSDQWDNLSSSGAGNGKQKAVMVVAGSTDPIYAAEEYLGDFQSERGFVHTKSNKLNDLADIRLMETWRDFEKNQDRKREKFELFFLSTIDKRVLPFKPVTVEPTVQDVAYHPFDLSYHSLSLMSVSQPEDWKGIGRLNDWEKKQMASYLSVDLSPELKAKLDARMRKILGGKTDYFEKVDAVLQSFSEYKYEMGYDDDTHLKKIDDFLFKTKSGDCTEFSHSAALLARMAGIPSRVVTGYIASQDLQTPAHRRGVRVLRSKIPLLQKYPPEQLYLVTTSHHHSWAQFFMPGYGWVDFETTAYAIPPEPKMDPNNMDVLIPMIDEEAIKKKNEYHFPWRLTLRVFGILTAVFITGAYLLRFGKEFYYGIRLRGADRRALRAMLVYFYMKLAANGFELKKGHETPMEYGTSLDRFQKFFRIHTMLYYRELYAPGEREEAMGHLRESLKESLKEARRKGFRGVLGRLFSLRGLYYK